MRTDQLAGIGRAVERDYGIRPLRAEKIKGGSINENFFLDDGRRRYIFKVYTSRNAEEVQFECDILMFLRENGFPCPEVVLTRARGAHSFFKGRPCAVLSYIPGRVLAKTTPSVLFEIGKLLGKKHVILSGYKGAMPRKDTSLAPAPDDFAKHLKEGRPAFAKRRFLDGEAFIDFIEDEMSYISFPPALPLGIVHNDVKPGNIVVRRGEYSIIDFDNVNKDALLYDLLTTLMWTCLNAGGALLKRKSAEALLNGYQTSRSLTEAEKEHFFDGLRFRLLREAFVWPFRVNSEESRRMYKYFLTLYGRSLDFQESIKNMVK